jgi:hypothetical protein
MEQLRLMPSHEESGTAGFRNRFAVLAQVSTGGLDDGLPSIAL